MFLFILHVLPLGNFHLFFVCDSDILFFFFFAYKGLYNLLRFLFVVCILLFLITRTSRPS